MRLSRIILLLVILVTIEETVRLWFVTPAVMAAHFNIVGLPDRFVSKAAFFGFQIEIEVITTAVAVVSRILLVILPVEFINMPNRNYWLSPDRRTATVERLGSFLDSLFSVIMLATLAGFELAVAANLRTPIFFDARLMGLAIAGMTVFAILSLVWLIWSFRIPSSI